MPLGSERTLGLAGPYGTPLIAELPAPADPAGGVSCAKACPGRYKLPSTARTSAVMRDIWPSGNFNNKVSRGFPRARPSTSPCDVHLGSTVELPAPKSHFRSAPDNRHVATASPCRFRAISDHSSAQNTSRLSVTLGRALNTIEDGAEATGHNQISRIYN